MKKIFKFIFLGFSFLLVVIIVVISFISIKFPKVSAAPEISIKSDSAVIARGAYLANHVAVCIDCHSQRDWKYFAGPIVKGTEGMGGEGFTHEYGFPGNFYAKNITPASLKSWSDGELFRAIVSGVNKDGAAFFPVMPYPNYGSIDAEDIHSIIAYIRTLPAISNQVAESKADFPMNIILKTIPQDPQFTKRPDTSETILYGKYLLTVAACGECHTKQEKGEKIPGMELAGGFEFKIPNGTGMVRSANITSDKEAGIGAWSKELFVNRFKYYQNDSLNKKILGKNDFNTVMPWRMYAGMTDADLGAIYTYLQTVKPIKNKVTVFSPAIAEK